MAIAAAVTAGEAKGVGVVEVVDARGEWATAEGATVNEVEWLTVGDGTREVLVGAE